jgi:hypothetical protein
MSDHLAHAFLASIEYWAELCDKAEASAAPMEQIRHLGDTMRTAHHLLSTSIQSESPKTREMLGL